MLGLIASGEAALVVGTHAVIQEQVQFRKLALAIIDEQHRFGVARLMVRDYGMSQLGPVALSEDRGPSFLGLKGPESRTYSEQTALEVDREVQSMVVEALERARAIVRQHREKLESMAARLLTAEVIEEEDIERLWGPKVTRPGTIESRGHTEAPPENPNRPAAAEGGHATWSVPHAAAGTHDPEGA